MVLSASSSSIVSSVYFCFTKSLSSSSSSFLLLLLFSVVVVVVVAVLILAVAIAVALVSPWTAHVRATAVVAAGQVITSSR